MSTNDTTIHALTLPIRWEPDIDDDLTLFAGRLTVGSVYRTGNEWRAYGLLLTPHPSRGHKTQEEAKAALLSSLMELGKI